MPSLPTAVDRADALSRLNQYWDCRALAARQAVNASSTDPVFSMIGHYLYAGLSGVFDASVLPGSGE